jgi:hypothetical protein
MLIENRRPVYIRQRFLLAFIRRLEGSVTATELQKLVFLYSKKNDSDFYEFIPYKFGSYSFQLAEDIEILRRDGYLAANTSRIQAIGEWNETWGEILTVDPLRGNNLIQKAYREYPYYAINSEITGRLFSSEEAERFKQLKQSYIKSEEFLFTIGYEGKTVEAFVNLLIQNNIRLLCDVRKNPISRKFGFSKSKLARIVKNIGIEYTHIPELGIESDKRKDLETLDDYQALFADYEKALPSKAEVLDSLFSLLRAKNRVALVCYEKEPSMCHRHIIRDYFVKTYNVKNEDL